MKKFLLLFIVLINLKLQSQSYVVNCPDTAIYFQNGNTIYKYQPSLPVSASNPSLIINGFAGSGLAVSNFLNGTSGPSPTFYTVIGGNYHYFNGGTWINTGHGTGDPSAVNPAGGGCYIFNLVGGTGNVYRYNGSGPGTLLVNVPGFAGGGPYDLATDVSGSFFVIKTTMPQAMYMYDESGSLLITFNMTGMPNVSAGGGLAVFGNKVYVHNATGFYTGLISGTTINFTSAPVPAAMSGAGDFANCPTLTTGFLSYNFSNTGPWSCSNSSVTLNASGWPAGTTYSWTGPGLYGGATSSTAIAVSGGMYKCTITAPGNCPTVLSTSVTALPGGTLTITASPSNTLICMGNSQVLTGSGALSYTWSPSSSLSSNVGQTVTASPTVNTTYMVSGSSGTCVSTPSSVTLSVAVCSGVNEHGEHLYGLNIFPNPSNGDFSLKTKKDLKAFVVNELGQNVFEVDLNASNNFEARISGLSSGVYFLRNESRQVLKNKIVVISH